MSTPPVPDMEHIPNHNSHVLEHCESQCFELMSDVCDLQHNLCLARALLYIMQWRNVVKQLLARRPGVPDVPHVIRSNERLVMEWEKELKRKLEDGWRRINENDRLWDSELVAAFGR